MQLTIHDVMKMQATAYWKTATAALMMGAFMLASSAVSDTAQATAQLTAQDKQFISKAALRR
jgi:spore maturation protein CgeB